MMNLKVGVMPGRLVEVIVEEGTTEEIFNQTKSKNLKEFLKNVIE